MPRVHERGKKRFLTAQGAKIVILVFLTMTSIVAAAYVVLHQLAQ